MSFIQSLMKKKTNEKSHETRQREAVESLNYEAAKKMSQTRQRDLKKKSITLSENAKEKVQKEQYDFDLKFIKKREKNRQEAERAVKTITNIYQRKFVEIEAIQRTEAEKLKDEWIEQHEKQEQIAKFKLGQAIHSSKVLISSEYFDSAIEIRNEVESNELQLIEKETCPIDEIYRKRFIAMIERHRTQFDSLFNQMEQEISITREDYILRERELETTFTFNKAMSPVKAIAHNNLAPQERANVLDYFLEAQVL